MASIRERNGKFNVIYSYTDADGKRKQKWETYATKAEAKKRKKEIEYKEEMGSMIIPQCKTMKDLLAEYVALYGKDNWALSTYDGNVSLINISFRSSGMKNCRRSIPVLLKNIIRGC